MEFVKGEGLGGLWITLMNVKDLTLQCLQRDSKMCWHELSFEIPHTYVRSHFCCLEKWN